MNSVLNGALSLSHRAAWSSHVEVNQKTKAAIMVHWLVFPNHSTRMLNCVRQLPFVVSVVPQAFSFKESVF